MSTEAMKLALEVLISYGKSPYIKQSHPKRWVNGNKAIKALEEAQTKSAPITVSVEPMPLYTTPPQRKPLTDEQIEKLAYKNGWPNPESRLELARAIEAAHGIKE